MFGLVPWIILFPALGAACNLVASRWGSGSRSGIIASSAAASAFVVALLQWIGLNQNPDGTVVELMTWIEIDALRVNWALQVDTLSVTMMLLVTGVGTIIHVYAIGYMRHDERCAWFFVYLNLFLVAMLVLVAADSYLMLFVGWEGVGLCSFLLIGFWFDKPDGEGWKNSSAARKAFLVNRIGDAGFVLALLIIGTTFGSFSFRAVFEGASSQFVAGSPTVVLLTLLLTMGAAAKSAQIPLFVWLPEAMAGPTPVSALIHAATMVTAGIYMITRSHVLFALAPLTGDVIMGIGALTALLAAGAAVAQSDIKRVLAYSTISQLGFMMAAVGMAAYGAAVFHLVTHAFFKALLFLAAGSVVHSLGHGGDMRAMGGLWRKMPITFITFAVGALSLAGLPPLAGFFSKDEILGHALVLHPVVFVLLSAAAGLTAFYIGRQVLLVFFGTARSAAASRSVESPRILVLPLVSLAILSAVGGALNLPGAEYLADWLHHTLPQTGEIAFQPVAAIVSLALSLCGFLLAYVLYGRRSLAADAVDPLALRLGGAFDLMSRGWGLNDWYQQAFVHPFNRAGQWLAYVDDQMSEFLLACYRVLHRMARWLARADDVASHKVDAEIVEGVHHAAALVEPMETHQFNWNVAAILSGLVVVLVLTLWIGVVLR